VINELKSLFFGDKEFGFDCCDKSFKLLAGFRDRAAILESLEDLLFDRQ
jgi:hypothetical protein